MKLLIIQIHRLGDSIVMSHVIEGLVARYPDIEIDLIAATPELINNTIPNIRHCYSLNEAIPIILKNPFSFRKKLGIHKKYDYIFSMKKSSLRARLFKLYVTSATKTQYFNGALSDLHMSKCIAENISVMIGEAINPERFVLLKEKLSYNTPYATNQNKEYNLAICPDASIAGRHWGRQNFYEIAKKLSEKYNIFLFSGPNQIDDCAYIEQNLVKDNIPCVNLQGKTSQDEFIAAMSKMDLAITNDSGPMHVAGLVDIPVISIMGPTTPSRMGPFMHDKFYPIHKKNICPPCVQTDICKKIRRKKDKAFPCVSAVTINEVMDVIYNNDLL